MRFSAVEVGESAAQVQAWRLGHSRGGSGHQSNPSPVGCSSPLMSTSSSRRCACRRRRGRQWRSVETKIWATRSRSFISDLCWIVPETPHERRQLALVAHVPHRFALWARARSRQRSGEKENHVQVPLEGSLTSSSKRLKTARNFLCRTSSTGGGGGPAGAAASAAASGAAAAAAGAGAPSAAGGASCAGAAGASAAGASAGFGASAAAAAGASAAGAGASSAGGGVGSSAASAIGQAGSY